MKRSRGKKRQSNITAGENEIMETNNESVVVIEEQQVVVQPAENNQKRNGAAVVVSSGNLLSQLNSQGNSVDGDEWNTDVPVEAAKEAATNLMYKQGREFRKRVLLCAVRIYKNELTSNNTATSSNRSFTTTGDQFSESRVKKLLEFLEKSIQSYPFIHCNLKTNIYVNKSQDILDYTDIIYRVLTSFLLIKELEPLHNRIVALIKRLMFHLRKHDFRIFYRALLSILSLVDKYNGDSKFVLNLDALADSSRGPRSITIDIPEIFEKGFITILQMLYQFWSVSKSGTEISTRFIQAVVKTWNFSEEKFRCEVLIGFPRRILTKQSEFQLNLIEVIEAVLKHVVKFGIETQAVLFLNQIWSTELSSEVDSVSFVPIKVGKVLLNIVIDDLTNNQVSDDVKEYIINLLLRLKANHKYLDGHIQQRLDLSAIKSLFLRCPLALRLLEVLIYNECVAYSASAIKSHRQRNHELVASPENSPNNSESDTFIVSLLNASDTWKTFFDILRTFDVETLTNTREVCSEVDEHFLNLHKQLYMIVKISYNVYEMMTSKSASSSKEEVLVAETLTDCKLSFTAVPEIFVQDITKVFCAGLQRTSRPAMNIILKIMLETLPLISKAKFLNLNPLVIPQNVKDILIFCLSSSWCPIEDCRSIAKKLPFKGPWRCLALSEENLLQKCVESLTLEIFEGKEQEQLIRSRIVHAMQHYNSCVGIVKGILSVLDKFPVFSRKIDLGMILDFLTDCGKKLSNVWKDREDIELLAVKAYARLVCYCWYTTDDYELHPTIKGCVTCEKPRADQIPNGCVNNSNISDIFLIQFAQPFFLSKSLKVRVEALEFLVRFKNHSVFPSLAVLQYYYDFLKDSSNLDSVLIEKLMGVLSTYLELDNAKNYPVELVQVLDDVFKTLRLCCQNYTCQNNYKSLHTMANGLINMSQSRDPNIQLRVLKILVFVTVVSRGYKIPVLFTDVLTSIAKEQQLEPFQLVSQQREYIAHEFVKRHLDHNFKSFQSKRNTLDTVCAKPTASDTVYIRTAYNALKRLMIFSRYNGVSLFLNQLGPAIIIDILPNIHKSRKRFILLHGLAKFANLPIKELLVDYFPTYYPPIALSVNSKGVLNFLQAMNVETKFVAKCSYNSISNELISYLDENTEKVFDVFKTVLNWVHKSNTKENDSAKTDILNFISGKLLGLYQFLQNQLADKCTSLEVKRRILRSFSVLLSRFDVSHLSPTKFKLYIVLSSFANIQPELHGNLFGVWLEFAKRISKPDMPDMIVQILAATALLDPAMKDVEYNFLLNSLYEHDKESFQRAVPQLHFVQDYLKTYVKDRVIIRSIPHGKDLFALLLSQLGHCNSHIRFHATKKLRDELSKSKGTRQIDVQKMILESPEDCHNVWKVIMHLLNSRGKLDRVNEVATECIGLVAAVDPFRVSAQFFDKHDSTGVSTFDVLSPPFLATFLDRLSQLLQGAYENSDFDVFAFTIQEVLRQIQIKAEQEDPVWKLLTSEARSVLGPMMTSKYILKREAEPICSYPIFGSEKGKKFHDWACHFIYKLVSLMKPSNYPVDNFQPRDLFDLSKLIAAKCPDFALFILPHIIFYAARECSLEELEEIVIELNLVMKKWIPSVSFSERVFTKLDYNRRKNQEAGCENEHPVIAENLSCTNAVFNISDYISHAIWNSIVLNLPKEEIKSLQTISLPRMTLSKAAFGIGSYHRALKYCERAIVNGTQSLQPCLPYLLRIYVALNEIDSIAGVSAVSVTPPSKFESIISLIALGRREETVCDLQGVIQQNGSSLVAQQGLIQAYLSLDQPQQAFHILDTYFRSSEFGTNSEEYSRKSNKTSAIILQECRLEACWRLEKWDELEELFKKSYFPLTRTWEGRIAQILYNLKNYEYSEVTKMVESARKCFIAPLMAIENDWDSYVGRYDDIVRIHILTEIQQLTNILVPKDGEKISNLTDGITEELQNLFADWKSRLDIVQNTVSVVDPIINVRKGLLRIIKNKFRNDEQVCKLIDVETVTYLLKIAELEWCEKNYSRAKTCLSQAAKFSPLTFLQEARFLIAKGDENGGLIKVSKGLENTYFKNNKSSDRRYEFDPLRSSINEIFSKSLLLYAQLNDKLHHVDVNDNITNYTKACAMYKNEDNYFHLAKYFDKVLEDFASNVKKPFETQKDILTYYCNSLKYGCKHVHQSLPRILSIWFDHAQHVSKEIDKIEPPPAKKGRSSAKKLEPLTAIIDIKKILSAMTATIGELLASAPKYIFLTAYSQLVSRLCHENQDAWEMLKKILGDITVCYPQRALWMLTSVKNSSRPARSKRCIELMTYVRRKSPKLIPTINDYAALAEQLIKLANASDREYRGKNRMSYLRLTVPALGTLVNQNTNKILVPTEYFLSPRLPSPENDSYVTHLPFPAQDVYIVGIEDRVDIMNSLQRPKKIVFRGSDGKQYGVMCKPNDDLRKDSKVMEFNDLVNMYLSRSSESSKRRLYIRTYAVTPLNETCGIVEWVNNLQGYRLLIIQFYKECGIIIPAEVRDLMHCINSNSPEEKKKEVFEQLVKFYPEVLDSWFKRKFSNPQIWYKARLNYIRTAAVMSVVGYIMGLGDRHGENILIDTITGDLVHVDYNCIFNKGETLTWVERVPFRLTRNMINGFGPLGYEGVFRKTCEVTLQVLRENMEVILSTMEPFVFDPLVEWSSNHNGYITTGRIVNDGSPMDKDQCPEAQKHLKNIKLRLLGEKRNLQKQLDVRFSIEAQVNYLIQQATDIKNLCLMYPGWGPYL